MVTSEPERRSSHRGPLAEALHRRNRTCGASGTGHFVSSDLSELPPVAKRRLQELM